MKGSRRQTDFHVDYNKHILDETFEIKLTNQKQQPVNVAVIEHMYRGENWEITDKSSNFKKRDSHMLSFRCGSRPKARLRSPTPFTTPGRRSSQFDSSEFAGGDMPIQLVIPSFRTI